MTDTENSQMDVRDHEKTFEGFVKFVTWASIAILLFLVFLALVDG